mgnify:CR=1 FL=1
MAESVYAYFRDARHQALVAVPVQIVRIGDPGSQPRRLLLLVDAQRPDPVPGRLDREDAFDRAVERVLEKNKDLYERLA